MRRPILLVEDNEDDVFFMQQVKRTIGLPHPMHVLEHGRKAIAYLKGDGEFQDREKFPMPVLVLLDLKLPYVPGLDVLKWIREEFESKLLVIVLTASSEISDIDAAYRLGANSYLIKPGNIDALKEMMQTLCDYWLRHNRPPSGG